jgi:hypothetical protein
MPEADLLELFAVPLERAGLAYMVTGATAAILYGQPRTTNDLDVVIELKASDLARLRAAFPESDYYLPPDEVIRVELNRAQRGHLNALHHESGFKADLYPIGADALHRWAFPQRRPLVHGGHNISFAPPEDVILRNREYFRECGSTKHLTDIKAMLDVSGELLDRPALAEWVARLGLQAAWARVC